MRQYLTPEDYEIAAKNGINNHNAYQRFYVYGMSAHEAITRPMKRPSKYKHLIEKAKENGITLSYAAVKTRVNLEWSEHDIVSYAPRKRPRPENEYYEIAKKNGIGQATYRSRRIRGWTKERASADPVETKHRIKGRD